MKRLGWLLIFSLVFFACESGFEINLDCWVKHTSQVIGVETSILGEKSQVFVNLTWGWVYQRPAIDAVIIERSIGDSTHYVVIDTVMIDTLMFYNDGDSILQPNSTVYYRLNSLNGKAVESFKEVKVEIPPAQHFYAPDSEFITISNDTLSIIFARLNGFDTTDVAIYKGAPKSLDSLLNFLTDPIYDTTIADTVLRIANADSLFPVDTIPYTIRINSSRIALIDFITDTSMGFRAFIRQQK